MAVYTTRRRGDLKQLNLLELRRYVKAVLVDFPDVAGGYLFGSALDFLGRDSDIDLALIFREGLRTGEEENLAGMIENRLGRFGPHAFQVTVLRPAPNSFAFRVLRYGRLLYAADRERITDIIERVGREHDDLAPFRKTFRDSLELGF